VAEEAGATAKAMAGGIKKREDERVGAGKYVAEVQVMRMASGSEVRNKTSKNERCYKLSTAGYSCLKKTLTDLTITKPPPDSSMETAAGAFMSGSDAAAFGALAAGTGGRPRSDAISEGSGGASIVMSTPPKISSSSIAKITPDVANEMIVEMEQREVVEQQRKDQELAAIEAAIASLELKHWNYYCDRMLVQYGGWKRASVFVWRGDVKWNVDSKLVRILLKYSASEYDGLDEQFPYYLDLAAPEKPVICDWSRRTNASNVKFPMNSISPRLMGNVHLCRKLGIEDPSVYNVPPFTATFGSTFTSSSSSCSSSVVATASGNADSMALEMLDKKRVLAEFIGCCKARPIVGGRGESYTPPGHGNWKLASELTPEELALVYLVSVWYRRCLNYEQLFN
jgi:hypothetical protein